MQDTVDAEGETRASASLPSCRQARLLSKFAHLDVGRHGLGLDLGVISCHLSKGPFNGSSLRLGCHTPSQASGMRFDAQTAHPCGLPPPHPSSWNGSWEGIPSFTHQTCGGISCLAMHLMTCDVMSWFQSTPESEPLLPQATSVGRNANPGFEVQVWVSPVSCLNMKMTSQDMRCTSFLCKTHPTAVRFSTTPGPRELETLEGRSSSTVRPFLSTWVTLSRPHIARICVET